MPPYAATDSVAVVLEKSSYRVIGMDFPAPWFVSTAFVEISSSRPLKSLRSHGAGPGT